MIRKNDKAYKEASATCQSHMAKGRFDLAIESIDDMCRILEAEEKYHDVLKLRMLVFYIDLSGVWWNSVVDPQNIEWVRRCITKTGCTGEEFDALYMVTVQDNVTPEHKIGVVGSLKILKSSIR